MVNNQLGDQREFRISEILNILKKIKKYNQKEFIMQICVKYNVQQRKASEYIKIAQYMLKNGR